MGYIGTKPANAPVTSDQLGDGVIQTADIANGAVTVAKLAATGTKDSTTFLRGDDTFAVISTTPVDGSITDPKISSITTGSYWQPIGTTSQNTTDYNTFGGNYLTSYGRICSCRVLRGGTYSIRIKGYSNGSGTAAFKIYKNGVALSTELTAGSTPTTVTWNSLTFATGDLLQVYSRNVSGSQYAMVSGIQISCDVGTKIIPIGDISSFENGNNVPGLSVFNMEI